MMDSDKTIHNAFRIQNTKPTHFFHYFIYQNYTLALTHSALVHNLVGNSGLAFIHTRKNFLQIMTMHRSSFLLTFHWQHVFDLSWSPRFMHNVFSSCFCLVVITSSDGTWVILQKSWLNEADSLTFVL